MGVIRGVFNQLDPRTRPFIGGLVLAIAHAIAFLLAFPPFDAWFLALVAPLPLMLLASRTRSPRWSALATLIATAPMWLWHHAWIADVTTLGFPLLVLYLSLYPALFVWITARLRTRWPALPIWVVGPLVWTGLEVIRGEVIFGGYPWFLIAHPLIVWQTFAFASATIGAYALSAITTLPSAVMCAHLLGGWKSSRLGAITLMFFAVVLSLSQGPPNVPRRASVIVVQTAVAQSNRLERTPEEWVEARAQEFVRMMDLTIGALDRWPDADLIVWPETMFPGFTLSPGALKTVRERFRTPYADAVQEFSAGRFAGTPWLIGAIGIDGYRITEDPTTGEPTEAWDDRYNSMFLIEDGVIGDRYDKARLAPFGEVIPYIHHWPWLQRQVLTLGARGMAFDLSAGDGAPVLETQGGALLIGTPICFEAAAWDVCRDLTFTPDGARRADLLVNATNDGWFMDHPGARLNHLLLARWRAAELRTPVIRAANTGISIGINRSGRPIKGTFVDEAGAIIDDRGTVDTWGALKVDVILGTGSSGLWLGGILVWGFGLVGVIGAIGAILPRAKAQDARSDTPESA